MISCRQASQLLSQSLDRRLSRRERLSLRFHLLLCSACRRFSRQLRLMSVPVLQLRQAIEQNTQLRLLEKARARIAAAIESSRG